MESVRMNGVREPELMQHPKRAKMVLQVNQGKVRCPCGSESKTSFPTKFGLHLFAVIL